MRWFEVAAALITTLVGGGFVGAWLTHIREKPKAIAEAKRITAEAESVSLASLERIIDRLERRVSTLELQIVDCHKDRDLALTAARFLFDKLNIITPEDEVLAPLREYLAHPPAMGHTPPDMEDKLDKLD